VKPASVSLPAIFDDEDVGRAMLDRYVRSVERLTGCSLCSTQCLAETWWALPSRPRG